MNNEAKKRLRIIVDKIGRAKLVETVGRTTDSVTDAYRAGVFPSSWYPDVCDLFGKKLPTNLFSFEKTKRALAQTSEPAE